MILARHKNEYMCIFILLSGFIVVERVDDDDWQCSLNTNGVFAVIVDEEYQTMKKSINSFYLLKTFRC